jgi:CheY-like chemotaxis protein
VSVQRPLLDGQPGDEVLFQVRDSGIGIPPDQLPRVFDAFHQVDGSFGRRHKGTGLGLTITREIARAMGGDIACDSIVGRGSVFTLCAPLPLTAAISVDLPLPLQERETPADAGTDPDTLATAFADTLPATLPAASPPHVLLAEDNAVNALVAEASLANLGMRVTRVENGRLALAQLCQPGRAFDVVLMDCQMPELDGIEATQELRTWERTHGLPAIPVIALTANAMGGDRQRCIDAGMDDHLAKPFRQEELRQALGRHLRAQATAPEPM